MEYKNIIFDLHGVLFDKNFESFKLLDKGYNILNDLSSKNSYEFYICTNWNNSIINTLNKNFLHIMNIFKAVINPDLTGFRKPDKKVFEYLINNYNLLPEESLFIDDQKQNIDSALQIGIKAINIEDFDKFKKYL